MHSTALAQSWRISASNFKRNFSRDRMSSRMFLPFQTGSLSIVAPRVHTFTKHRSAGNNRQKNQKQTIDMVYLRKRTSFTKLLCLGAHHTHRKGEFINWKVYFSELCCSYQQKLSVVLYRKITCLRNFAHLGNVPHLYFFLVLSLASNPCRITFADPKGQEDAN